jgi:hypothetical protein
MMLCRNSIYLLGLTAGPAAATNLTNTMICWNANKYISVVWGSLQDMVGCRVGSFEMGLFFVVKLWYEPRTQGHIYSSTLTSNL